MNITEITNNYIIFEVESHSRELTHTVIFNRLTGEWSCTCEDYWYRKRQCKHMKECKKFIALLNLECISDEVYVGQTVEPSEVVSVKEE